MVPQAHLIDVGAGVEEGQSRLHVAFTRGVKKRREATAATHEIHIGEGLGLGLLQIHRLLFRLSDRSALLLEGGTDRRLDLAGRRSTRLLIRPPGGPERLEHLVPSLAGGPIGLQPHRHIFRYRGDGHVGPPIQERMDRLHPVVHDSEHEGSLSPGGIQCVHVRSAVQKKRDSVRAPRRGGEVQRRRPSGGGGGPRIRSRLQERLHHWRHRGPARQVERCIVADPCHGFEIGSGVNQHLRHLDAAALGSPVQGGRAVPLGGVDIGSLLEQCAHGPDIAPLSRVRHRGVHYRGVLHPEGEGGNSRVGYHRHRRWDRHQHERRHAQGPKCIYAQRVAHQTVSEKSPVLSPKLSMSSSPSLCNKLSITLAMGVPASAFRCVLPASRPLAPPTTTSGQRL